MDVAEQVVDLQSRRFQIVQQGSRERAVASRTVVGGGAVLGGEGDEHAAWRFDRYQAAGRESAAGLAHQLPAERIVTAGVEDHRSEERRVGKGCRCRWSAEAYKRKTE